MDMQARQLSWTLTAVLFGCSLIGAASALGQEQDGGVSLGVLAGVGLDDADSEESGRYIAVDVRLVRPLGDVLGGSAGRPFRGNRFEAAALRRRAADIGGSVGVGAGVTLGVEGNDTWPPPSTLDKAGKTGTALRAQNEGFLDHGGTLFGVADLLLVFPVLDNLQLIPFAGAGPFRTLENDSSDESRYTVARQWGLVLDYGVEVAFSFGPADLRVQYRRFRYQTDEVGYVVGGRSFSQEIDPIQTSALLVGLGINF